MFGKKNPNKLICIHGIKTSCPKRLVTQWQWKTAVRGAEWGWRVYPIWCVLRLSISDSTGFRSFVGGAWGSHSAYPFTRKITLNRALISSAFSFTALRCAHDATWSNDWRAWCPFSINLFFLLQNILLFTVRQRKPECVCVAALVSMMSSFGFPVHDGRR